MHRSKAPYYLLNALKLLVPGAFWRWSAKRRLAQLSESDRARLDDRINYYNKLSGPFRADPAAASYAEVRSFKKTKGWTYFFDIKEVIRQFPVANAFNYINGDVTEIPAQPSFVKSRPISSDNHNAVLLKLNKIRHFKFIDDPIPYHEKKDMVAWRGVGYQPHRLTVLKAFYDHPMCNIGQTKPYRGDPWEKGFMSMEEQLKYKFLLAIEGNDVATNLKWAMSSNSLVIMSKPKYETWFMEGRLQAGVHYVEVKEDYSDLIEKMHYYLEHEQEALTIINNANLWVEQFKQDNQEALLSLLVAQKYFQLQN